MKRNLPFFLTTLVVATALTVSSPCRAATLLNFDFDGNGGFTLAPDVLDANIMDASFSVELGTLTDFAGVSGRALGASQFLNGNRIRLRLEFADQTLTILDTLSFALRRSSTGPQSWQTQVNSVTVGNGTVLTSFDSVTLPLNFDVTGDLIEIDISGFGASSNAGTLRLDNLVLSGSTQVIPVPNALWLMLSAALVGLRSRRQTSSPNRHSRHASTTGKYRPSMIGLLSRKRMMRA